MPKKPRPYPPRPPSRGRLPASPRLRPPSLPGAPLRRIAASTPFLIAPFAAAAHRPLALRAPGVAARRDAPVAIRPPLLFSSMTCHRTLPHRHRFPTVRTVCTRCGRVEAGERRAGAKHDRAPAGGALSGGRGAGAPRGRCAGRGTARPWRSRRRARRGPGRPGARARAARARGSAPADGGQVRVHEGRAALGADEEMTVSTTPGSGQRSPRRGRRPQEGTSSRAVVDEEHALAQAPVDLAQHLRDGRRLPQLAQHELVRRAPSRGVDVSPASGRTSE